QFYAVINFAAESHVDRSINSPLNFIHTNVIGTSVLLDCARRHGVQRFVQISTDEVYGSLDASGKFTEQSPLDPSSPYSASKAGADLLVLASYRTYGQEVLVTDRLGHDRRYAIDSSLAQRELSWKPRRDFKEGLDEAIQWYIDNQSWWQPLLERTGRY